MSEPTAPRLLDVLPGDLSCPAELPLVFQHMTGRPLNVSSLIPTTSRPYRTRGYLSDLPPKPVSRCFPP
jgi:hypothetical protein